MTENSPHNNSVVATAMASGSSLALPLNLPESFPVALSPEQTHRLHRRLGEFRIETLPLHDIAKLGLDTETALSRALDGFLSRIDKQNAPQLFQLVTGLNKKVEDENLPALAEKLMEAQPPLLVRIVGIIYPPLLKQAKDRLHEYNSREVYRKSKTLADYINGLELTLRTQMTQLGEELRQMDGLKDVYRDSFIAFAEETAFQHNAVMLARAQLTELAPELEQDQLRRMALEDKLQALESRALAMEGAMSRLPADQLVIRQLQHAGIATLQELGTTMAPRFNSIKMTLLTLHGADKVRSVQRLAEAGAALDANLDKVRSTLMKEVVQTAATAPGRNRLEQAKQLQGIVADTAALITIAEQARETNAQEFEAARKLMAQSRQEMLALGSKLDPAARASASL